MFRRSRLLFNSAFRSARGIQQRQMSLEAKSASRTVEKRQRAPSMSSDDISRTQPLNTGHFRALFRPPTPEQKRRYRRRWDWHLRHLIYALITPLTFHAFLSAIDYYIKHYASLEELEASSAAYKEHVGMSVRNTFFGTAGEDPQLGDATSAATRTGTSSDDGTAADVSLAEKTPLEAAMDALARRLEQVESELENLIEVRRKERGSNPGSAVVSKARSYAKMMERG